MVAAVVAIARFLKAIESFETNAQTPAQLPDQVGAGIMALVIKGDRLPGGIVQVHITVGDGGPERLTPAVGETSHHTPVGQRLEVAGGVEGGIAVDEAGVVAHAAYAFPVDAEQLQRVPF